MISDRPPSPDPPDPPSPPSSPLHSSLQKDSVSQSPVSDLDKSVVASVAADLTRAMSAQLDVATVSLRGSSSVTLFPSPSTNGPLPPSPDLGLDSTVTPPITSDSVLANSSVSGALPLSVSWVAKVQGPVPRVTSHVSINSGIPRVRISSDIFKEGPARHREFVALTFLDKTPSMGKIHAFLSYLWGKGNKIEVFSNCFGTIVARIQSDVVRQRILEAQLWHIDGDVFIAQEWSHKFSYSKPSLEVIPIWVRFNNVPCDLITEVGLYQIGGALGHPAGVRNLNGFSSGEVLVKIDLSKPLSKIVEVETDEGDVITLEHSSNVNDHGNDIDPPSTEESQDNVPATGPVTAESKGLNSSPEVVSGSVSTATNVLEKILATMEGLSVNTDPTIEEKSADDKISAQDSATKEQSADKPILCADRLSTPDSSTEEEESADEPIPFPDRISAPYSVQYVKITNLSNDKFAETPPLSTRMIENADVFTNFPTNDDILIHAPISGSDAKLDGKPSVFGDLFDKNRVFIAEEWNSSLQKSRGGRPLKPSQKMCDSNWSKKRGRGGRGGHAPHI
ncbi:hypothetical protein Bca4012_026844 [Brassica carinata]